MATDVRIPDGKGGKLVIGYLLRDAFISERTEAKHMFRGGETSIPVAIKRGSAAWGMDTEAIEGLIEKHGVRYVEIRTPMYKYRTAAENFKDELKSYAHQFGEHRVQTFLPLLYWNRTANRGTSGKSSRRTAQP